MDNITATGTIVPEKYNASADDLWLWLVYFIEGIFMLFTNAIISLTFLKHRALQTEKEYILVAGLASADAFNGLAYLSAGFHRTLLTVNGHFNDKVSAWACMMTLHNLLWLWTDAISVFMILAISIDRLLSAIFLIDYIVWSYRYAVGFVLFGFVYTVTFGLVGFVISYRLPTDALYPRICLARYSTGGSSFYDVQYFVNMISLILSVICYIAVVYFYRRYFARSLNELKRSQVALRERAIIQRRITVSLAISSLFTFLLGVIPYVVIYVMNLFDMGSSGLMSWYAVAWLVTNVNPMLNVIIYMKRQREMRIGIWALFACKEMPPVLRLWQSGVHVPLATPPTPQQRVVDPDVV